MASVRETALQAFEAAISAAVAPTTVLRNEARPQDVSGVPGAQLVIVRDGDPGVAEETFGVRSYYWQHAAEVELIVQRNDNADRATALDDLANLIGVALDADRTLSGAVDAVRPGSAIADHEQEDIGTVPYGSAIMLVELWYQTTLPTG